MNMTNSGKQDGLQTESIAQEIEGLADTLRKFGTQHIENHTYQRLTEAVAGELTTAVQRDNSYYSARQVIQSHQKMTSLLHSTLMKMLASLERMEQMRLRREKYSPHWWEQTIQALQEAFVKNPEIAFQQWVMLYAQALIDWELETCSSLANTTFPYPPDHFPYLMLIRHGDVSLQNKDYPPTLNMLNYLVDCLSTAKEEERLLSVLLLIFIGRIHLYQMEEPERARQFFDQAAALAPRDGRPLAALGHILLAKGETGWAEANEMFSRAVEFSPDQPEGYIGKALLAEARQQWSEADDWYKSAIQSALDELDLFQFLSKLLAPGSGRLYMHCAHQLLVDKKPDRALAAVERSLEVGMDDGSYYPQRGATALKADILLTMSSPERTPDESKVIADMYFEAGKYYGWNREFQIAIDLFKKGRELDSQNTLMLFYLADYLRIMSQKAKPPYVNPELIRESLTTWEAGIAISETVDPDDSWVYIARSRISEGLALLDEENVINYYWQALLFIERALLLNELSFWWAELSRNYNTLNLYSNTVHTSLKAETANPDNILILEERAKALLNTGQFKQAKFTLNKLINHDMTKPEGKALYKSWQAFMDYFLGNYQKALENLKPYTEQVPDNIWSISLRKDIYRAMGEYQKAMEDVQFIWEKRNNPEYKANKIDFAWSAFLQGMFPETIKRLKPFLNAASINDRFNAQFLSGLCNLTLGEFKLADEHLSQALEMSGSITRVTALIIELEHLQRSALREGWPLSSSITAYLNQPRSILNLSKSKQKKMKTYQADPIKELEDVLSAPITGQPGSCSWLAANAGLGRLYLEANQRRSALKAYEALALYSKQVPEVNIGIKKAKRKK